MELSTADFQRFQKYIYETAGIKVGDCKRTLVGDRVRRRLRATGVADFAEYFQFLTSPGGKQELPLFLDEITTNETCFFRDARHFAWYGAEFLAEFCRRERETP